MIESLFFLVVVVVFVFENNIKMPHTLVFHISLLSDDISLSDIISVPGKAVVPDRRVVERPPL